MSRWSEDYKQGERDFERRGRPEMERDKWASYDTPDRDYFDGYKDAERKDEERREELRQEEAREERMEHERHLQRQYEQQQQEEYYAQQQQPEPEPEPEQEELGNNAEPIKNYPEDDPREDR